MKKYSIVKNKGEVIEVQIKKVITESLTDKSRYKFHDYDVGINHSNKYDLLATLAPQHCVINVVLSIKVISLQSEV